MPSKIPWGEIERDEWCSRFVCAWKAFASPPLENFPWGKAEAAYEVAGLLHPEEAALMLLLLKEPQRSISSRRQRELAR